MRLNWYFLYHTISNSWKKQRYRISQVSTPTKTYLEQIIQYCTQSVYLLSNPSVFSLWETFTFQILESEVMTTNILGTTNLVVCQTGSSDVKQQQGCVTVIPSLTYSNHHVLLNQKYNLNAFIHMYVVWQKSNETGKAVHELTTLLPPPSHGS